MFEAPGVNFNAQTVEGKTLIHYCLTKLKRRSDEDKVDVFKLFTQYPGFNWNIPDDDGTMPIHLATEMDGYKG